MKKDPKHILIDYRLGLAEDVITDARKLLKVQGSPGSIINRSYYAMFYATLAILATIDQGAAKHSGVISLFDRYFVKTGLLPKGLSKSLHRAFELRQQGDYGDVSVVVEADAIELLKDAEEFITAIRGHIKTKG